MNEDDLMTVSVAAYEMFTDGVGLSTTAEVIRDRFNLTSAEVVCVLVECGLEASDIARALYHGLHLDRLEVITSLSAAMSADQARQIAGLVLAGRR